VQEGDLDAARELDKTIEGPELFVYPGDRHLFADNTGRSGLTVVRVGTLDEPSSIEPTANIWTSSAPAWACLNSTLQNFEKQPQQLKATTHAESTDRQ